MKFEVTKSLNRDRDLSIRVGKFGWGTDGGADKSIYPIMYQQLSHFANIASRGSAAGAKHDHSGRIRRARHHVDSTTDSRGPIWNSIVCRHRTDRVGSIAYGSLCAPVLTCL